MLSVKRIWILLTIWFIVATEADVTNKRIPSGFLGMRGKKSMDLSPYDENYLQQIDYDKLQFLNGDNSGYAESPDVYYGYSLKRAPMGFQGMRGKKNYLMDTGPLPHDMADSFYNEDSFDKRGPVGFQGMRGKREFEYPVLAYPNKRGPQGFQGMRGKKSNDLSDEYLHTFDGENANDKNLVSATVKTDKSDAEQNNNGLDSGMQDSLITVKQRRAQNIGFYGVRGKKMPSSSSFFGMRGKKGPFDFPFRGKFVGVRGKKLSNGNRPSDLEMLAERLTWNEDNFAKRRGPSGFVGMRGKKWFAPEGDLSQAMSASMDNEEE